MRDDARPAKRGWARDHHRVECECADCCGTEQGEARQAAERISKHDSIRGADQSSSPYWSSDRGVVNDLYLSDLYALKNWAVLVLCNTPINDVQQAAERDEENDRMLRQLCAEAVDGPQEELRRLLRSKRVNGSWPSSTYASVASAADTIERRESRIAELKAENAKLATIVRVRTHREKGCLCERCLDDEYSIAEACEAMRARIAELEHEVNIRPCASCLENHPVDTMCPPHEMRTTGHEWFRQRAKKWEEDKAILNAIIDVDAEKYAEQAARIAEMKLEVEALREDAERYRWLKLCPAHERAAVPSRIALGNDPDRWERIIDAARNEQESQQ